MNDRAPRDPVLFRQLKSEQRHKLGQDETRRAPDLLARNRKMRHAEFQSPPLDRMPAAEACVAQLKQRQLDYLRHLMGIWTKHKGRRAHRYDWRHFKSTDKHIHR